MTYNHLMKDDERSRTRKQRVVQLARVQSEALELFERKNVTYGDSFAEEGPVGVIVRMSDKLKRFKQITRNGINLVDDESLRDTLIDLHNYSAMCIMLLDEKEAFNDSDS